MLINGKFRCAGCMKEIAGESGMCGCGYDNASEINPIHCLQVGTVLNDSYVIGKVIGAGGFGITYVGWDRDLEKKIAVKEFYMHGITSRNTSVSTEVYSNIGDDTEVFEANREKFVNEAKTLAAFMEEQGIVTVYRFFRENKTAYIVMEFVEGISLKEYLKQRGRLSIDETMGIIGPVMNSLARVHEMNMVHRDISPDNIMITSDGRGKLIDFGAARENNNGNRSLSVVLKHGFAPMEQYQTRGNQGPWTDVYALSATIYNCITGSVPNVATDRIMNGTQEEMNALDAVCSEEVGAVIRKGLSIKIEDRYHSVGEFKMALLEALNKNKQTNEPSIKITNDNNADSRTSSGEKTDNNKRRPSGLMVALLVSIVLAMACLVLLVFVVNNKGYGEKGDGLTDELASNDLNNKDFDEESSATDTASYDVIAPVPTDVAEPYVGITVPEDMIIDDEATDGGKNIGDTITFGRYEQDNNFNNGKEDIEWIIVDKNEDSILLVSKYALVCERYNSIYENQPWDMSSIRSWLNSEFVYETFDNKEMSMIRTTRVVAEMNPQYSTFPGGDTEDMVFLLSINEVNRYFISDELRKCAPTAYAVAQGAYVSSSKTLEGEATCWWWLRTPGDGFKDAANVNGNGVIRYGGYGVSPIDGCVRPALWIYSNAE
ncbi:MAG: serine/threonine protein kinase [Lachnospiraceae bacterium]|nr:serine/threonine protein kinase [Candidatus Colinaster scatohippi]